MVTPLPSVLAVMAHADDPELWAGGTLYLHARSGAAVTVAIPRSDEIRDKEAAAGSQQLGTDLHLLNAMSVDEVRDLLVRLRPEVVVTHNSDDIHPDHRIAAETVLAALPLAVIATGRPRRIYHCDGYNGLDRHGRHTELPVIVDVSSCWDTKRAAAAAHESQPITNHFWPMVEAMGRLHGRRIETEYAEAFRPMPILGRLPSAAHL